MIVDVGTDLLPRDLVRASAGEAFVGFDEELILQHCQRLVAHDNFDEVSSRQLAPTMACAHAPHDP